MVTPLKSISNGRSAGPRIDNHLDHGTVIPKIDRYVRQTLLSLPQKDELRFYYNPVLKASGFEDDEKAIPATRDIEDPKTRVLALVDLAVKLYEAGFKEKSLSLFNEAAEVTRTINYELGIVRGLTALALTLEKIGAKERAMELFDEAIKITLKPEDADAAKVYGLNNISLSLFEAGHGKKARQLLKMSVQITNDLSGYFDNFALIDTAVTLYKMGERERSLSQFDKIIDRANEIEPNYKVPVLNAMALAFFEVGEKERSVQIFDTAIAITENIDDMEHRASLLSDLALNLHKTGNTDRALRMLDEAIGIIRETTKSPYPYYYHNFGVTLSHIALNRSKCGYKAEDLFDEASEAVRKPDGSINMSDMGAIAYNVNESGDKAKALELFDEILDKIENEREDAKCLCYFVLASSLVNLDRERAREAVDYALKFAPQSRHGIGLNESVVRLSQKLNHGEVKDPYVELSTILVDCHEKSDAETAKNLLKLARALSRSSKNERTNFYFNEVFRIAKTIEDDEIRSETLMQLEAILPELK